ncbi:MAG: DUF6077 domain-containing protein [Candidatus Gastranaerophilales bacterium]|nr:DUF6077 domain-containing protein [Candidatus Gastranaerophilales bacterium]
MMVGMYILRLIIWLVAVPVCVGTLFFSADKKSNRLVFAWVSGQMLLWALFQFVCVPVIVKEGDYVRMQRLYLILVVALLVAVVVRWVMFGFKSHIRLHLVKNRDGEQKTSTRILWGIFGALLLLQLVLALRLTYADGDDAFFVAISTITENSEVMYNKNPYTGESMELDIRHGMAPFPIWITFLARMSDVRAVSVAHVAAPLSLIAMAYAVFYLIGSRLCGNKKEKIPLFMIFTSILVLFGDYSYYTVENFMLARSRQGKAALGSIIVPMLFFLLLLLLDYLQNHKKIPWMYWVLLGSTMTAGALASTMGAMLCCMLVGITALCGAVCYRRWKFLFAAAACCVPCAIYVLLYLLAD